MQTDNKYDEKEKEKNQKEESIEINKRQETVENHDRLSPEGTRLEREIERKRELVKNKVKLRIMNSPL